MTKKTENLPAPMVDPIFSTPGDGRIDGGEYRDPASKPHEGFDDELDRSKSPERSEK